MAEPEWAFEYLYEDVSDRGAGLAEWVNAMHTYRDGKYLSWGDYVAERHRRE